MTTKNPAETWKVEFDVIVEERRLDSWKRRKRKEKRIKKKMRPFLDSMQTELPN